MSALSPPPLTRVIGHVQINGKQVPVSAEIAWFRYWAQSLYDRAGGALGMSTTELEASMFEDAGIEETKAALYAASDNAAQGNEVAALREAVATLLQRIEAIEQGVSL